MTLWIRTPCVKSGKEGSLSFNSAIMLKERKDEAIWFEDAVVVTKL